MIKLGDNATDSISGFTGVVTARSEYLNGCIQLQLTPQGMDKDGVPKKVQWFDEPQLVNAESKGTGGPPRDHG